MIGLEGVYERGGIYERGSYDRVHMIGLEGVHTSEVPTMPIESRAFNSANTPKNFSATVCATLAFAWVLTAVALWRLP